MVDQVLISKRIYLIGESYSQQSDALSAGLAISLFQDAVEQLVWCITKHKDIAVKDTESFTSLLSKIEKLSEDAIPHKAKILELNKARVGFKHYGNLPASSESEKFRSYAYDFLVVASHRYLGIEFQNVSLASLIGNVTVRGHIEAAEKALADQNPKQAIAEAARARYFLFKELDKYLPKVDRRLSDADRLFGLIPELRRHGVQVFHYLTQYLGEITRFNVAALAGGNISEHLYFERVLPRVTQYMAGNTEVTFSHWTEPTEELANKAIKYVVETAVKVESVS